MKKIFLLPIFIVLFFSISRTVSAQSVTLTYPIAELGNCSSIAECKSYCDEQVHKDVCVSYAKSKGFYNPDVLDSQKEELLQKAKTELGCVTKDECEALCSLDENIEKCSAFAKKNNLPGGKNKSASESDVLQKAKTELGCATKEQCKSLCSLDENKTKCSEFARTNKLEGGVKKVGPGGCANEGECIEYCKNTNNSRECTAFGFVQKKEFSGPGGCTNAQSCREYCVEHSEECQEFEAARKEEKEQKSEKIEEERKITDKSEQKNENVQEKSPIIRFIKNITNRTKESAGESREKENESENEEDSVPTVTSVPTPSRKPEKSMLPKPTKGAIQKKIDIDTKVEACIKEGCIWKETYCNCTYKENANTLTKTPTPTKKPIPASYDQEMYLEYKAGFVNESSGSESTGQDSSGIESSNSGSGNHSNLNPSTTSEPATEVQGVSTRESVVDLLKNFFR